MRKRILGKEQREQATKLQGEIGKFRYLIHQLCTLCSSLKKHEPKALKYFDDLDDLCAYTTPEEMADLLMDRREDLDEEEPNCKLVFRYSIQPDYTVETFVTNLRCMDNVMNFPE